MAKDGKKLELYEILAAKRAKGKLPVGFESKETRQANSIPGERGGQEEVAGKPPGTIIVDDAVAHEYMAAAAPQADTAILPPEGESKRQSKARMRREAREAREHREEPEPSPPRQRTTREVVFALDTAFIFFLVVLALVGSSYFLGYKRGQEERPAGLAGLSDVEVSDPDRLSLRHLAPPPRAAVRPSEADYTLILRTEPASDDLPERLEMELAEALTRGRQETQVDFPGFIFLTGGNDPRYILAVGLARTANDAELNRLMQLYNQMTKISLSREPRPYIGCRVAPVRELGTPVF